MYALMLSPSVEKIMDGYQQTINHSLNCTDSSKSTGSIYALSSSFFTQEITNQNVLNSIIKDIYRDASEPMYEYVHSCIELLLFEATDPYAKLFIIKENCKNTPRSTGRCMRF